MRCSNVMLLGFVLAMPPAAMASLGGGKTSIDSDQVQMAATQHLISQSGDHSAHSLIGGNGATIREYVNAAGVVYAVSWQGPGKPDLAHLMGRYFQRFQAGGARRTRAHLRAPTRMSSPDLVVQTGGHPGAFWGLAYLPAEAPAGFDPAALQ